jgi:hypothetical protein
VLGKGEQRTSQNDAEWDVSLTNASDLMPSFSRFLASYIDNILVLKLHQALKLIIAWNNLFARSLVDHFHSSTNKATIFDAKCGQHEWQ